MISRALLPAVLAAAVPASALLLDVNSPLVPGITAIPGYSALASLVATTTVSAPGAMATPGIDSLTGVSVACLTSLAGLIPASPDQPGLCLGINQAIGIFGANVAQQGTSLVQPVKKYLDQVICSQDSCTANVIQNAREKLANDCSDADLALSKGVNIPNAVKVSEGCKRGKGGGGGDDACMRHWTLQEADARCRHSCFAVPCRQLRCSAHCLVLQGQVIGRLLCNQDTGVSRPQLAGGCPYVC